MKKSFITLIINYNGKKFLRGCLESLVETSANELTDVIVIDNNSSDGSREFVKDNFPSVRVVNTNQNLGFSGAYNFTHGLLKREASYQYYLILNNDTVVKDPSIFDRAAELFASDSNIGIINPTIIGADGKIQFQGGRYIFLTGTTLGNRAGQRFEPENAVIASHWSTGCALFIPQSLFDSVSGFDDYFMYQEDVGLSWKVLNLGYRVVTDCQVSITHYSGGTEKSSKFEHYFSERNRILVYYQNLSWPALAVMLPILLIFRVLMSPLQRSTSIMLTKLRANFAGLRLMFGYPRYRHSLRRDLKTILYFHRPLAR